ncbi:MAG: DNA repair protein RecO [Alphaproteobacteria bacterium]|nr:DNA repair protein RecO [Alphaproteobacteria bacterium]
MHQWDDEGIIISVSRYGEQSAIIRLFTENNGLFAGMAKGVFSKKMRGTFQSGNIVHAHWQARLEDQLGALRCELTQSIMPQLLNNAFALKLVNAACEIATACVPERIEEKEIYSKFMALINEINSMNEENTWLYRYVDLEFTILHALGFGLDLDQCAATGKCLSEELVYVSPKSARAVSAAAGEPYKHRLLPLPAFLRDGQTTNNMRQMLDGLALTGYFLESSILHPEGRAIPESRKVLLRYLQRNNV